jgi:hypothetical protein
VRNCTIRQRESGQAPEISTAGAIFTRRHYCQTAIRWLQRELAAPAFLQVPNYTTLRAGTGPLLAVSTTHAIGIRRRCCRTAWSLLQRETVPPPPLAARSCTKRRRPDLLRGRLQHQGRDRLRHRALLTDPRKTRVASQDNCVRSARLQRAFSEMLPDGKNIRQDAEYSTEHTCAPIDRLEATDYDLG